jgi:hypothetical protein
MAQIRSTETKRVAVLMRLAVAAAQSNFLTVNRREYDQNFKYIKTKCSFLELASP